MSEILLVYSAYVLAAGASNDESWLPQLMPFADNHVLWTTIGFLGQATFMTRFLLQWIESERKKESIITPAFWWQSLFGTIILLAYFLRQRDVVGVSGFVLNIIPYSRNLVLIYRKQRLDRDKPNDTLPGMTPD